MEERRWKIGKVEVILGQSSRTLKIVVLILLIVSSLALGALAWADSDIRRKTADMRAEAAQYEYENAQLETYISDLGTITGTERIAGSELGMVDPDTILIEAQVR